VRGERARDAGRLDVEGRALFFLFFGGEMLKRPIRTANRHYVNIKTHLPQLTNLAQNKSVVEGGILADEICDTNLAAGKHEVTW
jgi:hypothetical protein